MSVIFLRIPEPHLKTLGDPEFGDGRKPSFYITIKSISIFFVFLAHDRKLSCYF